MQFSGPWARGRSPATTVPGHASTAFSLLVYRPALHRPMLEKPGRRLMFVADVEPAKTDLYSAKKWDFRKILIVPKQFVLGVAAR